MSLLVIPIFHRNCIEKLFKNELFHMKTYFVYILECVVELIIWVSHQRLIENKSGKHRDSYTFSRRPLNLVFHAEYTDPNIAI